MKEDGVFDAPAGTTTDDTALALALLESIVEVNGSDPRDFVDELIEWHRADGFGAGRMTVRSIERLINGDAWYQAGKKTWTETSAGANAGNGA